MKITRYIAIAFLFAGVMSFSVLDPGVPREQEITHQKDTAYSYQKDILPLLQANCNPCHFPVGKVYKKLPFDDSVTVTALGKKLNTRLKVKEQQAIINNWVEHGVKTKR